VACPFRINFQLFFVMVKEGVPGLGKFCVHGGLMMSLFFNYAIQNIAYTLVNSETDYFV